MNWLHFLIWVAGIYTSYYLVNILIDIYASKHAPADNSAVNELTFLESLSPVALIPETANNTSTGKKNITEPEVVASGGVPLKDLFGLVRQEAIVYIRAVSF